eukprot:TRINITY_DN17880_c0_g1_i4.p1 TRINITY_DN17880_c0_g1~~TRINITY_DN17880_c0_g1_i4.p1  ORF type:complete len:141 (-),score=31.58 TRINITY_DN17880_c0_g1_i4:10-405(-)
MELYNEEVSDLLDISKKNLTLRDTKEGGFAVNDLTEKIVTSIEDVMKLIELGSHNRTVGVSNLNQHSSRSHTIFRLQLQSGARSQYQQHGAGHDEVEGKVKVSELNRSEERFSRNAETDLVCRLLLEKKNK